MTVQKFGGAVLRTPEGFRSMISIISRLGNQPCVVVVSAIGSTTRILADAADVASKGAGKRANDILDGLLDDHLELAEAVIESEHQRRVLQHTLEQHVRQGQQLITSVALTRQCSVRTLDRVMALGEDLARSIATASLRDAGVDTREVDARSVIVTNSVFGHASPLYQATRHRVRHVLDQARQALVTVTQGFVACSEHGETTTMGRESSNLTASLLASCLGATDVTIWTDVDGVRTADPSIVATTLPIRHLHYDQARIAATYGLKLLYPTMIEPARRAGIAMRVAHAADPDSSGTIIDGAPARSGPMIATMEAEQRTSVNLLFTPLDRALSAACRVINELGATPGSDAIDVRTFAHDQATSIVVVAHSAPDVVRILHRELCETLS